VLTLVAKVLGPLLVKEGGDDLNEDDIARISNLERNIGHDRNKHMLLARKLARVDKTREIVGPEFTKRVSEQLGDDLVNVDRGLTQVEELVDHRAKAGE
jgi:hypothetical protein